MAGKKSPSCFLASKFSPLTSAGPWDYSFGEVNYHTLAFLLFSPLIRLLWESRVPEKMARPKSQTLYRAISPFLKLSCPCLGRPPENVFVWSYVHPLPYMSPSIGQDQPTPGHFPTEHVGRHMTHDRVLTIYTYSTFLSYLATLWPWVWILWSCKMICTRLIKCCTQCSVPFQGNQAGSWFFFSYLLHFDQNIIGK